MRAKKLEKGLFSHQLFIDVDMQKRNKEMVGIIERQKK